MHTTIAAVVLIATVGAALWIRRHTWGSRWETAITLSIALQAVGFALTHPAASARLGPALHWLTGAWNVEDIIGHDLYIVAASAIIYHALYMLTEDDHALRRRFRLWVELPATATIPFTIGAYLTSDTMHTYVDDMFGHSDETLTTYWVLVCGTVGYLLAYSAVQFTLMATDRAYRLEAIAYAASCAAGIAACILRIALDWTPWSSAPVWAAIVTCAVGFSVTSGVHWAHYIRRTQPDLAIA